MTTDAPPPLMLAFGPIIFVGDSVTADWASPRGPMFCAPQAVPRGIGDQSTREVALRLRSEIATCGARGLHLLCGRDDVLRGPSGAGFAAIVAEFEGMLSLARELHVRAFVGTIPPVAGATPEADARAVLVARVNGWLRAHAQDHGAACIDYHAALADPTGALRPDFAGPGDRINRAGYAAMEALALAVLTAPGLDQIWRTGETRDEESRRKFLHHFGYLSSNTRYPLPYVQFAGKPGSSHYGVPFDGLGFRNPAAVTRDKPAGEIRVFVVGDSTVVEGGDAADTLPDRLERILRAEGLAGARVYNFGVMSSCLTQMAHLVWSMLLDYRPDALVVLSGCTDLFQPWTYDPRPGYPYNAFIQQRLYDHFFDTHDPRAREDGLTYDALIALIYGELKRLRAETGWQTQVWEEGVVHAYQRAMHRLTKLSHDEGVPVVAVLQPVVLRKRHLDPSERDVASGPFLAYLDRQYGRLEAFFALLAARRPFRRTFRAVDLSGIFLDRQEATFTDIVHYNPAGREIVARRLADEVRAALVRRRDRGLAGRLRRFLRRGA